MNGITVHGSIDQRNPVNPSTIRGHSRAISRKCVNPEAINRLQPALRRLKTKPSRRNRQKVTEQFSQTLAAGVLGFQAHRQHHFADWLVLLSNGEGAIDLVHVRLEIKPSKPFVLDVKSRVSFSKHAVERLVERWRIRTIAEFQETIRPALPWLQKAQDFMPLPDSCLPVPLPDGLLMLRASYGRSPLVTTAIDAGHLTRDMKSLWAELTRDSLVFEDVPRIFETASEITLEQSARYLLMHLAGNCKDRGMSFRKWQSEGVPV